MVIKNPPKISPGLIFGGGGLIIGMIFVLRIRGAYFRGGGGGLIIGILRYFYLKHGGSLSVTISGERRYSHDLKQGGLELPADFKFRSTNHKFQDP